MGYATAMWLGFGEALAAVSGALTGLLFVALSPRRRGECAWRRGQRVAFPCQGDWLAEGAEVKLCTRAGLEPGTLPARWRAT
jgi:hypothetical protein